MTVGRGFMLSCCRLILGLLLFIALPASVVASPVYKVDSCLAHYQKQHFFITALNMNLSWEDIRKLANTGNQKLKISDKYQLQKLKKSFLFSSESLLHADKISLINVLLFSDKLSAKELTMLTIDELFLGTDKKKVLETYSTSLNYLNKLKNNFIFGRFINSLSSLFGQIYQNIENDPALQKQIVERLKITIEPDIYKFTNEQLQYIHQRSYGDSLISSDYHVRKIESILTNSYLALGDQKIVDSLVSENIRLAWHWPNSKISFDSIDQTATFSQMNMGSSIVYQTANNEAMGLGNSKIQVPSMTDHVSIQMYPPTSFDHSPFSYAYSNNYLGRIPKEVIESISVFDKTLNTSRVSYLTLENAVQTVGTLRIYELEHMAPLEFELNRRGVSPQSSVVIKKWLKEGKPVFEFGRFTLSENATKQERESFFHFLDLTFHNLARLYPDAEFICETGKSSLYRMYRMKWGFDMLEPVIKTDIDDVHILSVNAQVLLQKTKQSLESIRNQ